MRILVLPATGIGDMIMTFPVISSIKKNYHEAEVDVLVMNNGSEQIAGYYPKINNVLLYGISIYKIKNLIYFAFFRFLPLILKLRSRKYDWVVSPMPNFLRKVICLLVSRGKYLYGKNKGANPSQNLPELISPIGITRFNYDYFLETGDNDDFLKKHNLVKNSYIVLDPYPTLGKKDLRNWPYFDNLIDFLAQSDKQVVLVGRSKNSVKSQFGKDDASVLNLINKTNFRELLQLLKNAQTVISCDGGVMHMAYAVNTKVIGLFGPINPQNRIPINCDLLTAVYTNQHCSPCTTHNVGIPCKNLKSPRVCMNSISLEKILKILNV